MRAEAFVRRLEEAGGRAYYVGGFVRDRLMSCCPHDADLCICGLASAAMRTLFPAAVAISRSFPVFSMRIEGLNEGAPVEVALARLERKTSSGYRGFAAHTGPEITIEEDLLRRDSTINSMALRLGRNGEPSGPVIDPCGGQADIARRIIRATSSFFSDDPVRALRAARFAARLGFEVEEATVGLMASMKAELSQEPAERFVKELEAAMSCERPSVFFAELRRAGLLEVAYPELLSPAASKGDASGDFARFMRVLDNTALLSPRSEVRFASLFQSFDDEADGGLSSLSRLRQFKTLLPISGLYYSCAALVAEETARLTASPTPEKNAALLGRLAKSALDVDGFYALCRASGKNMAALPGNPLLCLEAMKAARRELALTLRASGAGTDFSGEELRAAYADAEANAVARVQKEEAAFIKGPQEENR